MIFLFVLFVFDCMCYRGKLDVLFIPAHLVLVSKLSLYIFELYIKNNTLENKYPALWLLTNKEKCHMLSFKFQCQIHRTIL